MKTARHFLPYFAQFFLEWEIFQPKVVEEMNGTFFVQLLFFENRAMYEEMWK